MFTLLQEFLLYTPSCPKENREHFVYRIIQLEAKEIQLGELQSKTDACELPVVIAPQELGGVYEMV